MTQAFIRLLLFSLGPSVYELVCALLEWSSCFLQFSGIPAIKCLWASKSLGFLLPMLKIPPPGSEPNLGLRTSFLWEDLCDVIIFPFMSCPFLERRYGIWFYCHCPLRLSRGFFFVFGCRISLLVCFSVFFFFVNGCFTVLILVFSWDEMSSCPSLALLFLIEFVPNNLKTSSHMYLEKKSFLNLVLLLTFLFFSHRGSL